MAFPYPVMFFDLGETLITTAGQWVPGAKAVLANLSQRGVRLGIISNTGNLERSEILEILPADFDLTQFEEQLVLFSSEVGLEKPDPEIFRLALEKADVMPSECLFCTEALLHTLSAQHVGMHTVRLSTPPDNDMGSLIKELETLGKLIT